MDGTAEDDLAGELLDLTRRLRGQLRRHAALGAWAAPGGASARSMSPEAEADAEAEPETPGAGGAAPRSDASMTHAPSLEAIELAGPAGSPGAVHAGPGASRDGRFDDVERAPHGEPAGGDIDLGGSGHADRAQRGEPAARRATTDDAGAGASGAADRAWGGEPDARPGAFDDSAGQAAGRAPIVLGRRTLPQIRAELGECTRCKLHGTRRSIVFGVGAADTPLMFVGEAPGEQEDRRGEPFVGPAGQLLDRMIEAMGWTRASVYIANTTKCRPPNNRNPQPDELAQCMPFLHAQIAAIAPRIIVALGRPASNQLLGTDAPISALRGRFHDYAQATSDGVSLKIMPTFHPAYLLRDPDKKRAAWSDLKLVMAELARLGIAAPGASPGPAPG
ncbi:MAG TPA: uracil-DNA glycosylase [Kofleriaceae bacterium]|nr:uracil-DNA glycosylase [Kofleriaceae bacterium]